MDLNSLLQILLLVKSGIIGLGACYFSLKNKQQQSHAELVQKIQNVQTTQLVANSTLNSRIDAAKGEVASIIGSVQGVMPAVQELVSSVQKSQGDIASIASGVSDTVASLKSGASTA